MSLAKFNKRKFIINTEGFEFKKAKTLAIENPDAVYTIRGVFINSKGKYDDYPVIMTDHEFIDMPSHWIDIACELLNDSEAVSEMNAGTAQFRLYTFVDSHFGNTSCALEFI